MQFVLIRAAVIQKKKVPSVLSDFFYYFKIIIQNLVALNGISMNKVTLTIQI